MEVNENMFEKILNSSLRGSSGSESRVWKRNVLIDRSASSFSIEELKQLKLFFTDVTNGLLVAESRLQVDQEDIQSAISLSQKLLAAIISSMRNEESDDRLGALIDLVTQLFRVLRNVCAGCLDNQLSVHSNSESLLEALDEFVSLTLNDPATADERDTPEMTGCITKLNDILPLLRASIQFAGNAVTGCVQNGSMFWKKLFTSFGYLMSCGDTTLKNYTSMLIFNSLDSEQNMNELILSQSGLHIVTLLIKHVMDAEAEWSLYTLQKLLGRRDLLHSIWTSVNETSREFLLELTCNALRNESSSNDVHVDNVQFISEQFIRQVNETPEQVPTGLGVTLECLCLATSGTSAYAALKDNKELTIASIDLLRRLHQAMPPKSLVKNPVRIPANSSTIVTDNEKQDSEKSDLVSEMTSGIGAKRRLVQLLANLTYQHRINQDWLREAGGIRLILEQTQIDDNNPMIVQFAVLAIRNLCENNEENQRYIAAMRLEGLADNVDYLTAAGLNASLVGDKIIVNSCGEL